MSRYATSSSSEGNLVPQAKAAAVQVHVTTPAVQAANAINNSVNRVVEGEPATQGSAGTQGTVQPNGNLPGANTKFMLDLQVEQELDSMFATSSPETQKRMAAAVGYRLNPIIKYADPSSPRA